MGAFGHDLFDVAEDLGAVSFDVKNKTVTVEFKSVDGAKKYVKEFEGDSKSAKVTGTKAVLQL